MVPDIETRLKAILKSMQQVIIPAIGSKEKLAIDQANIIVGNLDMLLDQHDKEFHYDLAELHDYCSLAKELIEISKSEGLDNSSMHAASQLLEDARPVSDITLPTQNS